MLLDGKAQLLQPPMYYCCIQTTQLAKEVHEFRQRAFEVRCTLWHVADSRPHLAPRNTSPVLRDLQFSVELCQSEQAAYQRRLPCTVESQDCKALTWGSRKTDAV